ncbi:MAG: hypothetical protein K0U63_11165 [Cyanobacteria bacterium]|jgi:hypothetical protein|nr:hypothetical protein [Cyanobacteriota bacterium]
MAHPQHPGRTSRPLAQPQLPAFCRTRRPITTTLRLGDLRQLQWLLWLVLALQLSTVLLVLAGPVPPAAAPLLAPVESRP